MKSALQTIASTLGHQLEDRVRRTNFSKLDLLILSSFDYEIHEWPPSGAPQDFGPNMQDDIVITNRVHWQMPPITDATVDAAASSGSGWEVAPVTSLVSRWGHSQKIGLTSTSVDGVPCEDMEE